MNLILLYLLSLCFLLRTGGTNGAGESLNFKSGKKTAGTWTIEWSPDEKYWATGGDDSLLYIYDASKYTVHRVFKMKNMIKGVSWHPKEKLLAVAVNGGVQLLDLDKETITTLPTLTSGGRGIGWNFNGQLLALADGR